MDKVRKWCNCQIKCKEDTDQTWTCTAHLAEGHAFQCHCDSNKVRVRGDGYYTLDGCPDFEPPDYNCNAPDAYGNTFKNKRKEQAKAISFSPAECYSLYMIIQNFINWRTNEEIQIKPSLLNEARVLIRKLK